MDAVAAEAAGRHRPYGRHEGRRSCGRHLEQRCGRGDGVQSEVGRFHYQIRMLGREGLGEGPMTGGWLSVGLGRVG
jgi:hypothetical protein